MNVPKPGLAVAAAATVGLIRCAGTRPNTTDMVRMLYRPVTFRAAPERSSAPSAWAIRHPASSSGQFAPQRVVETIAACAGVGYSGGQHAQQQRRPEPLFRWQKPFFR